MNEMSRFIKFLVVLFVVLISIDLIQTFLWGGYESNPLIVQYPRISLSVKLLLMPLSYYVFGKVEALGKLRFVTIILLDVFYIFVVFWNTYVVYTSS